MDHAILEDAFPFVLHSSNLVVSAEHDVRVSLAAFVCVLLALRVRVI
jgi:hypothetical protein